MTLTPNPNLQNLMTEILEVSPQLFDQWQATAIIESLGYTDRIVQKEFDFPHTLALGEYVYKHYQITVRTSVSIVSESHPSPWKQAIAELGMFLGEFSRSFIYAVPLILILLLENFQFQASTRLLPPQLATLLTLAMMTSLCASAGFVQMISRRGGFYMNLGEVLVAQRVCLRLLYLGIATNFVLGLLGLWFGFYRGIFLDEYLMMATVYYWLLCILWMLFAVLTVWWRWGTLLLLIALSTVFLGLAIGLKIDTLEAQVGSMAFTLVMVVLLLVFWYRQYRNPQEIKKAEELLPRLSAMVYLLTPYFIYGVAYFAFIFSDRLIAGWAINPASGLVFAVRSDYQASMDIVLLDFLLIVPLIEYLSYRFIRFWYKQAHLIKPRQYRHFKKQLQQGYALIMGSTVVGFSVLFGLTVWRISSWQQREIAYILVIAGAIAYLLFILGLLNAILLFSLNQPYPVVKSIGPGLFVSTVSGYLFANAIAPNWVVLGFIMGAAVFLGLSSWHIQQAIQNPDYAYYIGGY